MEMSRQDFYQYMKSATAGRFVPRDFSNERLKIVRYCFNSLRSTGAVEEHFAYLRIEQVDDIVDAASFTAMQRKPVTVLDVQEHPVVDKRKPIVAYERTWPINETTERLIATFGESLTGKRRGPTLLFGGQPEGCQPIPVDRSIAERNRNILLIPMRMMTTHDWTSDPWLSESEYWHFASTFFIYQLHDTYIERLVVFPMLFDQNLHDVSAEFSTAFARENSDYRLIAQQPYDGNYEKISSPDFAFMTLRDPSAGIEEYVDLFSK